MGGGKGKGKSDVILGWNCWRKDKSEKRASEALPKREFGKLGIRGTEFPPQNNSHFRKITCEKISHGFQKMQIGSLVKIK